MKASNLIKLKKLNAAATSGTWCAFVGNKNGTIAIHTPADTKCGDIVGWMGFDGLSCSKKQKAANARYIAGFNPAVTLAMLDHIEALQAQVAADALRISDLEKQWEERAPTQYAYDAACAALHKHRARADAAEGMLNAAMAPVAWRYRFTGDIGPFDPQWKIVHTEDECNPTEFFERQQLYALVDGAVAAPGGSPITVQLTDAVKQLLTRIADPEETFGPEHAVTQARNVLAAVAEHSTDPAIATLTALGYSYHGGQLWKPPVGPAPDFSLMAKKDQKIAELGDQLHDLAVELSKVTYHLSLTAPAVDLWNRWADKEDRIADPEENKHGAPVLKAADVPVLAREDVVLAILRVISGPSQISATAARLFDTIARGELPGITLVNAGNDYGDAYQGAREDLAIWKRRALEAEKEIARRDAAAGEAASFEWKQHYSSIGKSGPWVKLNDRLTYEKLKHKHSGDADYEFRELFTCAQPALLPPEVSAADAECSMSADRADAWASGANWMRDRAIALGCPPDKVLMLPDTYQTSCDAEEVWYAPSDIKNMLNDANIKWELPL